MKKNFFIKNLLFFLLPMLIPILVLGTLSVIITQNYVKDYIDKSTMNVLEQTRENVELITNESDPLSLIFDNNSKIFNLVDSMLKSQSLSYEESTSLDIIKGFLNAPSNARPYIHSIYVYSYNNNGNFLTSTDGVAKLSNYGDTTWYKSFMNHQYASLRRWTERREIQLFNAEQKTTQIISVYQSLYPPSSGVIVLNLLPHYIEKQLNALSTLPQQKVLVLNENNQIILSNDAPQYFTNDNIETIINSQKSVFSLKLHNQSFIISKIDSKRYGWKYVSIVPQRVLYQIPIELSHFTGALLLICFISGLMLTFYFTKKNYDQITNIINIIDSAENGCELPALPNRVRDEYGYIVHNILKTYISQNQLKFELTEKKYRQKSVELIALQSQINPHFLVNTLKSVYWMSYGMTNSQNSLCKMVESITDILYYSLDSPGKMVSIEEELRYINNYIHIQKVRYPEKFDFSTELEGDVHSLSIVKLTLQPLIENCIFHGILEKESKGKIKLKIRKRNSQLYISTIDNGIGIKKEVLSDIKEKLKTSEDFSEHIGLFNTNRRLQLTYGDNYNLKILSHHGLGTAIYISVSVTT